MIDILLTPHDLHQRLAQRVRALRKRQAWTQRELAERAGVGVATVARLERSGQAQLSTLLRAAAHRCVSRWGAEEITSAREQDTLAYDAVHLVSAMLMMSYVWPEPVSYEAGLDDT